MRVKAVSISKNHLEMPKEIINAGLIEGPANTELEAAESKFRKENIKDGLIGGSAGAISSFAVSVVADDDSQESINVVLLAGYLG